MISQLFVYRSYHRGSDELPKIGLNFNEFETFLKKFAALVSSVEAVIL